MCDVGVRCAADTRRPASRAAKNYYKAHGRTAPAPTPLARVETSYATNTAVADVTTPAPAKAGVGGHMSAAHLTGEARAHKTPAEARAATAQAAAGRFAGSAATSALTLLRQQGAARPALKDPHRAAAATAAREQLGRAAGTGALAALSRSRDSMPIAHRALREPQMAQAVCVTQSAGARLAAGGAVQALSALRAKGWRNPHAGVALI